MKKFFISIYIVSILSLLAIIFGVFPITHEILEDKSLDFIRQVSKGTFSLVSEKLEGLDPEQQKLVLEDLEARFGYPVKLYKIGDYYLDDEDFEDIMQGKIVDEDDQAYVLIKRLGNSGQLIVLGGPFPKYIFFQYGKLILWLGGTLFLILPALAWAFFTNRDMERIEASGARFASGDHSARVKVPGFSPLAQVASVFNSMASKAQSLIASQKELTNSVSHEIRTPLSRIQFSVEMAGDLSGINEKEKKHMERIAKDADEIENLVDEMLTYAKFESEPQIKRNFHKYEIVSWLEKIIHEEQVDIQNAEIILVTESDTKMVVARFEPLYLGRALKNLIRNAAKYTDSQILVTIEPGEKYINIHIDDDGKGIPERYRDKVFEPFFRMDGSRDRASGGYGLGLAIVKRIVSWHNGTIKVSTSPLSGARFSITLPF